MQHGIGAGWPTGGWGIGELWPGQTSLPAALGKIPEAGQLPAPDSRHLQRRHNQVQAKWSWAHTLHFLGLVSGGAAVSRKLMLGFRDQFFKCSLLL